VREVVGGEWCEGDSCNKAQPNVAMKAASGVCSDVRGRAAREDPIWFIHCAVASRLARGNPYAMSSHTAIAACLLPKCCLSQMVFLTALPAGGSEFCILPGAAGAGKAEQEVVL